MIAWCADENGKLSKKKQGKTQQYKKYWYGHNSKSHRARKWRKRDKTCIKYDMIHMDTLERQQGKNNTDREDIGTLISQPREINKGNRMQRD